MLLALVGSKVSAGVQVEVGYALALSKKVIFALDEGANHQWFNKAIILAGQAKSIASPVNAVELETALG